MQGALKSRAFQYLGVPIRGHSINRVTFQWCSVEKAFHCKHVQCVFHCQYIPLPGFHCQNVSRSGCIVARVNFCQGNHFARVFRYQSFRVPRFFMARVIHCQDVPSQGCTMVGVCYYQGVPLPGFTYVSVLSWLSVSFADYLYQGVPLNGKLVREFSIDMILYCQSIPSLIG